MERIKSKISTFELYFVLASRQNLIPGKFREIKENEKDIKFHYFQTLVTFIS